MNGHGRWTVGLAIILGGVLVGLAACQDNPTEPAISGTEQGPSYSGTPGPPWRGGGSAGPTWHYANVDSECALANGTALSARKIEGGQGFCAVEFPVEVLGCSGAGTLAHFPGTAGFVSAQSVLLDLRGSGAAHPSIQPNEVYVTTRGASGATGAPFSVLLICP